MAAKYLTKWRPGFIERNNDVKKSEGVSMTKGEVTV